MKLRKIGIGSISLLLALLGIAWSISRDGFCIGDTVLNFLKLSAWTNNTSGTHIAIVYSLVFFVPAFILGGRYRNNFGAKAGRTISIFFIAIDLLIGALVLYDRFF